MSKYLIFQERKKNVKKPYFSGEKKTCKSNVKILNISGGEKKTGRSVTNRQKNLKKPYFSGETKKT